LIAAARPRFSFGSRKMKIQAGAILV